MMKKYKNRKIQKTTDIVHKMYCQRNHVEDCDYHYGNWETDIRHDMKRWYDKVVKSGITYAKAKELERARRVINKYGRIIC